jgi:glycogen debranching enzyme
MAGHRRAIRRHHGGPTVSDRTIPAPDVQIVPATDLGDVEVSKVGNLYLLTDARGDIRPDGRGLGLYELDTRILSTSVLRLNGASLTLLRGPHRDNGSDTIQLTNPEIRRISDKRTASRSLARRDLSVTRTRRLDGRLLEQVVIESYSTRAESIQVELGLGVDMADIFEVRGYHRDGRGTIRPIELEGDRARFGYDGLDGQRRTTSVRLENATLDAAPDDETWTGASVVATWRGTLRAGQRMTVSWTVGWNVGRRRSVGSRPAELAPLDIPVIRSDHELLDQTLARSEADLKALRNAGPKPGESYLAAGIPWFTTLFGRDSLIAALETVAFIPSFAKATLDVLARLQATSDDPLHDAEPGKIVHELRTGEMAATGEVPFSAYYGSIDSTPLWLILLGETYAWTADDALLDRLWPNALAAIDWIDRYGDQDGDGFVEYRRRSDGGLANQGWKDSGDAIRHTDGRLAEGSIALAEVQGYVYAAKRSMATLARRRGDAAMADRLDAAADELRRQFDAAFWLPKARFYAMALDGDRRPVATIGSNVGQALWSGIVPTEREERVAERLLESDMFSGWGVRTLAAGQVGYNPVGYHTGSIWPHDNAIIAAGLKWHGATDPANRLAGRLIEAARWFPGFRLPELFCGFARAGVGAPVAYPVACSPQAWSAAAPYFLLRTMIGLRADASARRLELVHPVLPDWLGQLKVSGLPIGGDSVDLLVHRFRGRTSAELIDRRGDVEVVIHA